MLSVGTRLTDFATGSHSIFANPDVRFASINVNVRDTDRLGATGIVGDAKRTLAALADAVTVSANPDWQARADELSSAWEIERADALNPDQLFDKSAVDQDSDIVTTTDAILTQGQIIGIMQEHSRPGDVVVAAAGGPPGDLQKVWDATDGRTCHLEFGFSCMGYEIPAAMGVRLAHPDPDARITAFLGDGTFLMAPTELVTAAQEGIAITLVVPENHGYQVIHRLQMFRHGREFGNEFRYRTDGLQLSGATIADKAPRLDGEYLNVDLVQVAAGLGAKALRPSDRRRAARRPRRDPRVPGHGRHRRPGHPARRPAGCRGLVGRRPGRGLRDPDHRPAARGVRGRQEHPAVVRMSPTPLNGGALAGGDPRRCEHVRHVHRDGHPGQRRGLRRGRLRLGPPGSRAWRRR